MDPLANPYTPNAGARPPALVGRDRQIADFELLIARLSRGHTEKSMIITGLRGVGKTVLLGRFRQIAEDARWAVVEWEISKHDDTAFRRTLATQFRTDLLTLSPRHRWQERANRGSPTGRGPLRQTGCEPAPGIAHPSRFPPAPPPGTPYRARRCWCSLQRGR